MCDGTDGFLIFGRYSPFPTGIARITWFLLSSSRIISPYIVYRTSPHYKPKGGSIADQLPTTIRARFVVGMSRRALLVVRSPPWHGACYDRTS